MGARAKRERKQRKRGKVRAQRRRAADALQMLQQHGLERRIREMQDEIARGLSGALKGFSGQTVTPETRAAIVKKTAYFIRLTMDVSFPEAK